MECTKDTLQKYLNEDNKDEAVLCALELLETNKISVISLFEDVLVPGLNNFACSISKQECMWKLKVRKLISKTIISASYIHVIKQKKKSNNIKTIVCCPRDEASEINSDIVNDYLLLAGYDSVNLGASSDYDEIVNALTTVDCKLLVLSVTNPLYVIRARKLIDQLEKELKNVEIAIVGPGFACDKNRAQLSYDYYITDYKSVLDIDMEDSK